VKTLHSDEPSTWGRNLVGFRPVIQEFMRQVSISTLVYINSVCQGTALLHWAFVGDSNAWLAAGRLHAGLCYAFIVFKK